MQEADWRVGLLRLLAVFLMVASGAMLLLVITTDVSVLRDSAIAIGVIVVGTVWGYLVIGYLPGGPLGAAFAILLAALLFGRSAYLIMLLSYTVLIAGIAIAIGTGFWEGPNLEDIDPQDAGIWFRTSVVSVIVWAGIGYVVLYVVNTVESVSEKRRVALKNLQAEIAEREAAESARREAETIASQAQKMEAVGQLAAGIAHDVNNALLVIQGWNELRGEHDSSNLQRDATDAIDQAALHTAQLSRQLLTFARKEVRRPKYLYLDELVGGMISTLRRLVGSKIEVVFDSDDQALIHADESQIQQLLFNLVINARDALAGKGTIQIRVRHGMPSETSEYEGNHDDWTALEIEDDGPGIDEASQQRVFEPFFTTKAADKGTGLGLSTALGIVQQSHGHIELSSRPGRTVFSVYLPLVEGHVTETTVSMPGTASIDLGLRILVVEDDPLARQLIVKALKRSGNIVVECAGGDEVDVVLAADPTPFDLLCSDAVFPGTGLGAVLDSFERHSPDAQVLICSGYVREELAIRKVETGDYAFLAKPFSGSQLIAEIRNVLNRPGSA